MWEKIITSVSNFFVDGEIWAVVVKVLVTALLTAAVGLVGTLIGKIISKYKESKIYKYAATCVAAAEQKFPNEGKKMGPEKMAYVMDQLAIKFSKIKESSYLYNIAEAAVLELNRDLNRVCAIEEFEEKYGEKPLAVEEETAINAEEEEKEIITEMEEKIQEMAEIKEKNTEKSMSKKLKNKNVEPVVVKTTNTDSTLADTKEKETKSVKISSF